MIMSFEIEKDSASVTQFQYVQDIGIVPMPKQAEVKIAAGTGGPVQPLGRLALTAAAWCATHEGLEQTEIDGVVRAQHIAQLHAGINATVATWTPDNQQFHARRVAELTEHLIAQVAASGLF